MNRDEEILLNVAAIICHNVGMLAALYNDYFLLDDGEVVLCRVKQRLLFSLPPTSDTDRKTKIKSPDSFVTC